MQLYQSCGMTGAQVSGAQTDKNKAKTTVKGMEKATQNAETRGRALKLNNKKLSVAPMMDWMHISFNYSISNGCEVMCRKIRQKSDKVRPVVPLHSTIVQKLRAMKSSRARECLLAITECHDHI